MADSYPPQLLNMIGTANGGFLPNWRTNDPGTTFAEREATHAARYAFSLEYPAEMSRVLISDGGTSDLVPSPGAELTAGELITQVKQYHDARRAEYGISRIVFCTPTPAYLFDTPTEAERQAFNAAVTADPSIIGADAVAAWHEIPELQDYEDTDYYSDGLHFTTAAAALAAQAVYDVL